MKSMYKLLWMIRQNISNIHIDLALSNIVYYWNLINNPKPIRIRPWKKAHNCNANHGKKNHRPPQIILRTIPRTTSLKSFRELARNFFPSIKINRNLLRAPYTPISTIIFYSCFVQIIEQQRRRRQHIIKSCNLMNSIKRVEQSSRII